MTAWCSCMAVERDMHVQKINIATKFDPQWGPKAKKKVWRLACFAEHQIFFKNIPLWPLWWWKKWWCCERSEPHLVPVITQGAGGSQSPLLIAHRIGFIEFYMKCKTRPSFLSFFLFGWTKLSLVVVRWSVGLLARAGKSSGNIRGEFPQCNF